MFYFAQKSLYKMKELLKNLGVLLVLVGVVILVIYNFVSQPSNAYLWSALACIVVGILGHIFLNKYIN